MQFSQLWFICIYILWLIYFNITVYIVFCICHIKNIWSVVP